MQAAQAAVHALQLLQTIGPHVVLELVPSVESLLPAVCACMRHEASALRAVAAGCIAELASAWLTQLRPSLLRHLVSASGHLVWLGIHAVALPLATLYGWESMQLPYHWPPCALGSQASASLLTTECAGTPG